MSAMLRGATVRLVADAAAAKWNLIFPRGEWHGANLAPIGGSITIDDEMLSDVVANWVAAGKPPLPVRKTHAHLDESDPVKRLELEKAYGLLKDMRVTADGLEVLTEWNSAGAEAVRAGEWNFWSPEWQPSHTDRATGEKRGWWLSGVALTNDPFFNSMPAVAASSAIPPRSSTGNQLKGKQMNYAKIAAALGMPEDSTEEAIIQACNSMKAAFDMKPQMQASLTAEVSKAIEPLRATVETLKAEVAKKDEALFARDVEDVIKAAKAEGFQCEPLRDAIVLVAKAKGLDEARKLAAASPKVNLTTTGVPGADGKKAVASALEYSASLEKFSKESSLSGLAAVRAFHRAFPEMAEAASQPIPAPIK